MEVRILGPFEVVSDGVVVTPSAPKLRQVLALLSTCANRVVRVDQLMEELWDDRPPLSATTTLQTYVYQLRKILHHTDGESQTSGPPGRAGKEETRLHTWPRGYLLALAPGQLDVTRFEELTHRGRAELYRDQVERASETFREALRLWRAPVLTDIEPGPLLQAEIVRLTELYRSVLEWRIDADLRLGRHHELVGELTAVVAEHPMHEGLQGKLMLALHRAGRRSDALSVYQRVRRTLNQELGLEPSPDLQRLHNGILAADPSVEPPHPVERASIRVGQAPTIAQLPPDIPELVGRDAELAEVRHALTREPRSAPPVAVITGPPGYGKSAFCIHAAHDLRTAFPDGQLYAELADIETGPANPASVLADFLRSIGVTEEQLPVSIEERSALFRSWTADRQVLVVLDDAVNFAQLGPLLPSGSGCATLAVTRRRLAHPAITIQPEMASLDTDSALAMLISLLGRDAVNSDVDAARRLVSLCRGIPLVLGAAAGRLRLRPHWPIRRLVNLLISDERRFRELIDGDLSLQGSVESTYRLLPPSVQDIFCGLVDLITEPISAADAAFILGGDEHQADAALEELVEFRLCDVGVPAVDRQGHFTFYVPPMIQQAAQPIVDEARRASGRIQRVAI